MGERGFAETTEVDCRPAVESKAGSVGGVCPSAVVETRTG